MADSEDIGGISVTLGANDARLLSDLEQAEKLAQAWAKQHFEISVGARFTGGTGTPGGGGGGGDLAQLTKAIEAGFANATFKAPPRQQQAVAPRVVAPGVAATGAAAAGSNLQRAINEQLAKSGEVYNELTGEIEKTTTAHRAQRTAVDAATRSVRQETETPVPTVDTGALQTEIKSLVAVLAEFRAALTAASEKAAVTASTTTAAGPAPAAPKTPQQPARGALRGPGGMVTIGEAYDTPTEDRATTPVVPPAGGKRRRGTQARAAAATLAPEGDEEEQGKIGLQTRMAAFELREGDRHAAVVQRHRVSAGQLAFRESERQRIRELRATRTQYAELESLADDFFSGEEQRIGKKEDQASLQALSNQAQAANNAPRPAPAPTPVGPTPSNQTPEERARAERNRRDQETADRANAPRPRRPVEVNALRAAQQRDAEIFASARRNVSSPEEREQRIQENIAKQQANVAAAASTGRTSASRIAAFGLGTAGRRAEADVRAADARRELTAANREALPFQRRLAEYDEDIANSSGRAAQSFRQAREAFRTDPLTVAAFNKQAAAIRGVSDATREYEKLQSGGNIVRNLGAIALGSFAFSAALKAVDLAVSAVTPVLGDFIDLQTGYASKSTAVTTALAKQTIEQRGNVNAVLAQTAVTAGLSQESADFLDTQLKLTTQVKAGALAQQQSSDLFRAAAGTGQGVPQGLGGGFGGIGGTPFLAQQLGGGKGLQEILAGDIQNLSKNRNRTGEFGDVPGTVNDILGSLNPFGENFGNPGKQVDVRREAAAQAGPTPVLTKEIDDLNDAMKRGAAVTGQTVAANYAFTTSQTDIAKAVSIAKANGDDLGASIAKMGYILRNAKGDVADFGTQLKALTQAGIGKSTPAGETLGSLALAQEQQRQREAAATIPALQSKQAYERPAFLANLERQQQFQLQTQLPAQQALQNLSNPLQPVGTGIASANAKEQQQIVAGQQRSVELQDQLNAGYAEGKQILIDTYKVPESLLNSVAAIGQEIASSQAAIRNEQADYAVAQYNFQLRIAKRTLQDINGLTGRAFGGQGQSYLGQLEKENLALSRQGQLLQFAMSQRQINFQTALAGFQTPGVTPEERQARVKEAQIEASFAQKQLDISKQIFGNQVQIVDIQNLRQGADLAAQIGLLLQGRKVTIDTAQAEERLALLNKLQAQQVAKVSTYIQKVDTLVGKAFADINALEIAAGKAMAGVAVSVLQQYALVIRGITDQLNGLSGGQTRAHNPEHGATQYNAAGAAGTTTGAMNMTIGEAGSETYAILRNPRSVMGAWGGGGAVSVTFGNVYVRSEADIDDITRKVTKALGRDAALKGLRSNG